MKRFVFLTKTVWSEPPRLLHQLADLLTESGHQVAFFELPFFPWGKHTDASVSRPGIEFKRLKQLIHHKLRLFPFLHKLNAKFEAGQFHGVKSDINIQSNDIIVNFNYDYFFLREIFPNHRIITIINDDFWCRAILDYEAPLRWALKRTCLMSDVVLTVSEPLLSQLQEYCDPIIFYPWATQKYTEPSVLCQRRILLFWGYINRRFNYDYIFGFSDFLLKKKSDIRIQLIGPIQNEGSIPLKRLKATENIEVLEPRKVEELNFDDVLASLIPYVSGNKADDVTSIPNKAFAMLANGLPLAITGMPHFIREPFVLRLGNDYDADLNLLQNISDDFMAIQPPIRDFVENNSSKHRIQQFLSYL